MKQITLVLRSFDGVAYTSGSDTDKEIHLSLDYIFSSVSRARDEILGVLIHEVVHCYQYNAKDTCPGGFIEGVAGRTRCSDHHIATEFILVCNRFREVECRVCPAALESLRRR